MTEAQIQKAIVAYLRQVMPDAIVHHSANEGNRGGRAGTLDGARKKAMGQMAGFPDLLVLTWSSVGPMFFEVKKEGGYATKTQKAVHAKLRKLGYQVAIVRSIDDVREALSEWRVGTAEAVSIPMEGQIS